MLLSPGTLVTKVLITILMILVLPFQLVFLLDSLPIPVYLFPFIMWLLLFATILWIYILACLLLYLKTEIISTKWNRKKFVVLAVIIVACFVAYGFLNLGWADVFVPTADDSGATVEGVREIVKANNQFAIELYSEISSNNSDRNIFFSPWSISNIMAMVYEGARGETAEEIQGVFHFPSDNSLRRSSYAKMLNILNKAHGKYTLKIANAIWLQKEYPFLDEYKDIIKRYYLGEVENLDFVNAPRDASSKINDWVSKNTNHKIRNIVSPGMFNEYTRIALTSAIYFKARWKHEFDKSDTKQEDFTLPSGLKVRVPMMRLKDEDLFFNYTESDGVQILELPYKGDKISMLVLLPRTEMDENLFRMLEMRGIEPQLSDLPQLESILSEEKLQEWRNKLRPERVSIHLPKFTFETSYSLHTYLKNMGMNLAFTWPGANFSGMDGTEMLYIDKVLHKAYVDVNEEGTEAAAITFGPMVAGAAIPRYIEFRADHPFIFIIQERKTGAILFIGRVVDPRHGW